MFFRLFRVGKKKTSARYFSGLSHEETWAAPWTAQARRNLFSRLHDLRKRKAKAEEVLFVVSECRQRDLLRDPRDWVVAMSSLGHVHLWTETLSLLEAMHSETVVAVHAFNATISATQKAQEWQVALALFNSIDRYSLSPDTVTCNALLTAYDKGGQWQRALAFLDRVGRDFQQEPNVISYSAAISACERGLAWEEALQVFAQMQSSNILGDVVAFNATLSALDRGLKWQEALVLLEEMTKVQLKRSLASYGAAISACGNSLQWEESIELLNVLQKQMLQPSLIVMNSCLNACRKARNLHSALQLFNDMVSRSEKPDLLSYTSLISTCEFGAEWQLAIQLHEDAQLVSGKLDIMSFNALLRVCKQASRWEETHRILRDLEHHGLSPTVQTYKAVISACAHATRWSDALGHLLALSEDETPGAKDDLILHYGIVSKACVEAGLPNLAQALLAEAEHVASQGPVPKLPAEWLSVLDWQAALSYFEGQNKAMNDVDGGAQPEDVDALIFGLADVLLEAGRDADAMGLLINAQEAGRMSLWRSDSREVLDLHGLGGRGSCSATVAEGVVGAALLQMAKEKNYSAKHDLVIITGRGKGSIGGVPLLLPAVTSFLEGLGLQVRQDPGSVLVPRESLHKLWQGK